MPERIAIEGKGGSFAAYVARPAAGGGPGLLVIQEIFGINAAMRAIADAYAEAGYLAVVPDLFWRLEPELDLDEQTERELAFMLYNHFDEEQGIEDLKASLAAVRGLSGCTGGVGTVGYCLGGKLAFLMATRSDADCNISYYGVSIERNLNELGSVHRPLLLHLAEQDELATAESRERIIRTAASYPLVRTYLYPAVGHAFARVGSSSFRPEAAQLANRRTLELLNEVLAPGLGVQ